MLRLCKAATIKPYVSENVERKLYSSSHMATAIQYNVATLDMLQQKLCIDGIRPFYCVFTFQTFYTFQLHCFSHSSTAIVGLGLLLIPEVSDQTQTHHIR
jgi:hypothetical protein